MPEADNDKSPGVVRSVARALHLLVTLGSEGLSLTEAAQRADIPLPTALRLMRTLESESFAVRLDDGTFVLGPAAIRLAYEADPEGPLRWTVRDTVIRLRDRTNETTSFFVRRGTERLCLESAQSRNSVRWVCPRGTRGPLHLSASGKVLLAYGPTDDLLESIPVNDGVYECAGGRVRRLDDLVAELDDIRVNGVAYNDQESATDSWGFGIPLIIGGVCLGAFGFGIPLGRVRADQDIIVNACVALVEQVTEELGMPSLGRAPSDRVPDDAAQLDATRT